MMLISNRLLLISAALLLAGCSALNPFAAKPKNTPAALTSFTPSMAVRTRFSLGIDAFNVTLNSDSHVPDGHFFAWLGQVQYGKRLPVWDVELLARLETHATGIGLADQQIAIAVHPGAEFSLAAFAATTAAFSLAGQLVALGFHQGAIEALLQQPAARPHIAAGSGDLIFRAIAQGACLVEQGLAFQHLHWGADFLFDEHRRR